MTSITAFCQGSAKGYLYVYPSAPSAYPNQQGGSNNSTVQNLFQQHQVVSYFQSFPGAVTGNLGNAYEIHLNGDENALKTALESTNLFSYIEREPYMQAAGLNVLDCPEPCSSPQSVNDPRSSYELTMPGYLCAWNITQGNPSVVVAVVDTDFDLNHPDLQGQIISKVGIPGSPGCAYHGNVVAATIVAKANNGLNAAGVAPGVRVAGYVVKTNPFDDCTTGCYGSPWAQVWQAYIDGRRIINVSWTGAEQGLASTTLLQSIQEITSNGTLLIVAAGNRYGKTYHTDYSNFPGVINVGSVSDDGTIHNTNADPNQPATTYNQWVDLCAPGDGVGTIEFLCGTTLYNNAWGTSMSAPNVAGAAALILSVNPCLKPSEIENIIKITTCPMVNNPIPNETGTGYLNAYAAVEKAKGFSGFVLQNTTWSGENYVSGDVTVVNGITLNIEGTVKFSEGTRLIIRPGGNVTLNGKLTNSCMNPWEGVVVNGVSSASQYTSGQHGRFTCRPGSIIENANIAVSLWAGGILNANGAWFVNNGTGVSYHSYSNFWPFGSQYGQLRDHLGGITDCQFLWNNDFSKAANINSGIEMEEVRGIRISGCSFINERTIKNPIGNNDYGYGIKATDARFSVLSRAISNTYPPTSYDHSLFKGLGYGIYVGTAQNGANETPNIADDFVSVPYTVQQATFSECIYGIHNRFVSQATIVGNTFNMGTLPPAGSLSGNTPFTNIQVGVYIENGANGFELQENQFTKANGNVEFAYGSYCQNLGWFNNDIRRNTYTNVDEGNLADENNAITTPNRGLYYLCNTNATKKHDFYVYPGSDIRLNQGLELANNTFQSAGNTFTKANRPTGDFENNGPQVRYCYNSPSEIPMFFSGLSFSNVSSNACDVQYCLPPCRGKDEWQGLKEEYTTTRSIYQTAVNDMQGASAVGNPTLAEQKSNIAARYRLRLDDLSNTLSLHMVFDSTTYSVDSIRVWWQKMESPVSDMVVARDYLAKGQSIAAFAVLDAMPSKYSLSNIEITDLTDYRSIMQLMQGESTAALSQGKINQLLTYANTGTGLSAAWAKNILTVKGYHFPPQPKRVGKSEGRVENPNNKNVTIREDQYIVSPNPAKDYVQFMSVGQGNSSPVTILVSDATGRTIWRSSPVQGLSTSTWQTADIRSGIYFYTIQSETGQIQSGRISIIK